MVFRDCHRFKADLLRPFSSSFTSLIETPYLINSVPIVVGSPLSRLVHDISPYFITFFRASDKSKNQAQYSVACYQLSISHLKPHLESREIQHVFKQSLPIRTPVHFACQTSIAHCPTISCLCVTHGQLDSAYDTNRTLDTLFCINQFIPQHPLSSLVPSERHSFFRQYNLPVKQNSIPNFAHL